jgi:diguanylate cyclase (GGDEF)-like protein/PAS domain S-box-containing protein
MIPLGRPLDPAQITRVQSPPVKEDGTLAQRGSVLPIASSFYKDLLDHISDGVYFVDTQRRILFWNEAACRLSGYTGEEAVGRACPHGVLCHVDEGGKSLCNGDCPLAASLTDGQSHEMRIFVLHKLGRRVPVTVRVEPVRGPDGSIIGAVQIFSDDSAYQDARRRIEEMERLAFFDHVTGLPNRRFAEMSLQTALSEYHSHHDPFGVLLIDLDDFKAVNDRFGHGAGDRALREVGHSLVGALRPSDVLGRWGGDEFIAIVHHVNAGVLEDLARRCSAMVAATSFATGDGLPVDLSVSIGETLVVPADAPETLAGRADDLMYRNKLQKGLVR